MRSPMFLSAHPAARRDRRMALTVVGVSAVLCLAAIPFAKYPLPRVPAFIPIYQSALAVDDLVTAVLLFGQFAILRWRALAILASAYLFTACMAIVHLMSFPGLFSPTGLLGAGPQTTAWLYMFWHGGFPLLVLAYTTLPKVPVRVRPRVAVQGGIAGAVGLAAACTALA